MENDWISLKDRFPEESGRYLVFEIQKSHTHNCAAFRHPYPCCKVNIAYFTLFKNNGWIWSSFSEQDCNPTHWMALPNPPEVLENKNGN